jgi:NADPH-dependent 2,4-dienoyl-CoA reductase/sulfur reductase-like enzyme
MNHQPMTGLIVVGSGPAGVAAAEAFRNNRPSTPIRILTEDSALPYYRPPLSKEYLRGEEPDIELHPADWFDERSITLIRDTKVVGIDTCTNSVVDSLGNRYEYESLMLACGAAPKPLPVPGGESALLLRSLCDAATLRERAKTASKAVVIGAGFIGCEAAASLAMQGISTILLSPEPLPQKARLGSAVGKRIVHLLADAGVSYAGGVGVTGLGDGEVHLDSGITISGDLVLAATGVEPRAEIADSAGIKTDQGRIVVDEHQRTSVGNVFAAGDVALTYNSSAGRPLAVEHWQDAIDQGKVAGTNASDDGTEAWDTVPGFWTTIGDATLKYHAWGDGFDDSRFIDRDDGFTAWYEADGKLVGVLTLNADEDYERAEDLIRQGDPAPVGRP